jgi:hypothetical protein
MAKQREVALSTTEQLLEIERGRVKELERELERLDKVLAEKEIEKQQRDDDLAWRAEQAAALQAELAWWKDLAKQADMFLLAITNNAVLAGRGWQETRERLEKKKPQKGGSFDARDFEPRDFDCGDRSPRPATTKAYRFSAKHRWEPVVGDEYALAK